jgi:hypothetical protein
MARAVGLMCHMIDWGAIAHDDWIWCVRFHLGDVQYSDGNNSPPGSTDRGRIVKARDLCVEIVQNPKSNAMKIFNVTQFNTCD